MKAKNLVMIVGFFIGMAMILFGNSINGYKGLSIMFVGLSLLLVELYVYNRSKA